MFNPRPLPATQQGIAIVTAFKAELDEFHGLVDGRVVAIHDMLNTIGTHYPPPPCPALLLCTCLPTPNAERVRWCLRDMRRPNA